MARIDYYAIEAAIKTILAADATLTGVAINIEEESEFAISSVGVVEIFVEQREAPADLQPLRNGKATRYLIQFSLWCRAFSLESVAKACQLRDDLMGKVEIALMSDHTFAGTVRSSWLTGGKFETQEAPSGKSGYSMGGEIIVVADAMATV